MTPFLIIGVVASMFFFTGLTGRKALKEGRYAFLASMVSRLEEDLVAPAILRLLRENDLYSLTHLFHEKGLIDDREPLSFGDLWESERKASGECWQRYDRLLTYLPDDLRDFFGSLRILRDARNIEVLAAYVDGNIPRNEFPMLLEPGGIIEIPLLLELGESRNLKSLMDEISPLLPPDFRLDLKEEMDLPTFVRRLNMAAAAFIQLKVKQNPSTEVDEAFSHLRAAFDAKNVCAIARLKSEGTPPEEIAKWLVPLNETIGPNTLTRLAESEDYEEFLNTLLETDFGRVVLRDLRRTPTPKELWEASLQFIYSTRFSSLEESDELRVWRYFFLLEHEERTIRKGLKAIRTLTGGISG